MNDKWIENVTDSIDEWCDKHFPDDVLALNTITGFVTTLAAAVVTVMAAASFVIHAALLIVSPLWRIPIKLFKRRK